MITERETVLPKLFYRFASKDVLFIYFSARVSGLRSFLGEDFGAWEGTYCELFWGGMVLASRLFWGSKFCGFTG